MLVFTNVLMKLLCTHISNFTGKMVNFKLKHAGQSSSCAYCGVTDKDFLVRKKPTNMTKIRKCPAVKPLHGLTRGVECKFKAGYRNRAGVFKFRKIPSAITPKEHKRIDKW